MKSHEDHSVVFHACRSLTCHGISWCQNVYFAIRSRCTGSASARINALFNQSSVQCRTRDDFWLRHRNGCCSFGQPFAPKALTVHHTTDKTLGVWQCIRDRAEAKAGKEWLVVMDVYAPPSLHVIQGAPGYADHATCQSVHATGKRKAAASTKASPRTHAKTAAAPLAPAYPLAAWIRGRGLGLFARCFRSVHAVSVFVQSVRSGTIPSTCRSGRWRSRLVVSQSWRRFWSGNVLFAVLLCTLGCGFHRVPQTSHEPFRWALVHSLSVWVCTVLSVFASLLQRAAYGLAASQSTSMCMPGAVHSVSCCLLCCAFSIT